MDRYSGVGGRARKAMLTGVFTCATIIYAIGCDRSDSSVHKESAASKSDQTTAADKVQPLPAVRKLLVLVAPSIPRITTSGQNVTTGGDGSQAINMLQGSTSWVGIRAQTEASPAQIREAMGEPHLVKSAAESRLDQTPADRWYYRYDDWLLVEVQFGDEKVSAVTIEWKANRDALRLLDILQGEAIEK